MGKADHTLAYQIRQSFKPGEITPELANKIGYELGRSFTKGNHAFIVATHVDKSHIHSHIIFNSTSLDCTKKFRDFKRSGKALAQISDRICLENGLYTVMLWEEKEEQWFGVEHCKTPELLRDALLESYHDFSEQQLTHNRRDLTNAETLDIQSRCKQLSDLCGE